MPGFLAELHVISVGPLWSTIYNWAWFVAFAVAFCVHLVGTALTRSATVRSPTLESP